MAAMVSAVDDSIGDIIAELERQGAYDDTLIFFMSDNGPSREARNWLDGNPDPYYGGTTGQLKGHKGSLFEGGVRVPGIMSWKNGIPGGQVIDTPIAAMDVLPTLLGAIGADAPEGNFDGTNLLDMLTNSTAPPERDLFWEFLDQTSVRRGKWKLTLNGTLVENVPPEDSVFLADLDADMAEQHNLKDEKPDIAKELTETAQQWRQRMDDYWDDTWASRMTGPMLVPD
jgi:arylsulfatase A-like enzyme